MLHSTKTHMIQYKNLMKEFETIDIENNVCLFQYTIEYGDELNSEEITFRIYSIPANPTRWFSYKFRIIDNYTVKSEMMSNNGFKEFSKKGIPEKIIEIASQLLKKKIVSSPIIPQAGNYLVETSFKVWNRLVEKNTAAKFNEYQNCFELNISLPK